MFEESRLQQLLFQCAEEQPQALEELYTLTSAKLYGVALRLLQNRKLAEKALQEAFVRIWYKAPEYSPSISRPFAWMATIVRYQALRLADSETPQQKQEHEYLCEREIHIGDDRFAEDYLAKSNPLLKQLQTRLNELEKSQRHSILLSYFYGYNHYQQANKLKHPVGTLRSWIRRGMQRVRGGGLS